MFARNSVSDCFDRSESFDAVNNRLSRRVEIDNDPTHDLRTLYQYDGNDQLAVIQKPEGNRTFRLAQDSALGP